MPEPDYASRLRDLWNVRFYYFIWLGGSGSVGPFLNLFLARQGLDGVQIGWIVAIGSVIGLFAAPLWTRVSAQSRNPLRLLQISLLLTGAATVVLSRQVFFFWLAMLFALRILFSAGQSPLSDALALRVTEATERGYGSVRVWGSFGWAVIVLGTGWLNQHAGIQSGFIEFGFVSVIAAVLLTRVAASPAPLGESSGGRRQGFREVGRLILRTPALLSLSLVLIVIGVANLGILQFENIYLDQLGAEESLIGVASMVSSVVEIPGMLWADRLVRRLKPGPILLIGLGLNCALRSLVFLFPSVYSIIAARAVGGIAFSFYTVALVKYIGGRTAANQTATALAIFTVTLPSLINITCTPLVGHAFDLVGAHWLYLVSLTGYALGAMILGAARQDQK